jgi:hypothetical protein
MQHPACRDEEANIPFAIVAGRAYISTPGDGFLRLAV